jgi:tetratricopeptide (TPR) repeat protein
VARIRLQLILACAILMPTTFEAQQPVSTAPLNRTPEVRAAFEHFYDLDYPGALARFTSIAAAHPGDPMATDYLLHVVVFSELYRLDLLDTTFYATDGFLSGRHVVPEDPQVRDRVRALAEKAIQQADVELKQNNKDANALYARGWARALDAVYTAMVERSFGSALRMAFGAKNDCEDALKADPNYVDAKLVTGDYQYVMGALPMTFKLIFGMAGLSGSKSKGMEMLSDDAARGVVTSVEANTSRMLFLRREARYSEAEQIAHTLSAEYPHDFLFPLEEANLAKDSGNAAQAIALYRRVIESARQPGYFNNPHLELPYYGMGDTLRGQKMYPDAVVAYENAAEAVHANLDLKRRCLLAAAQVYDLMHDHARARGVYQQVIDLGSDAPQAEQARKWMKNGYEGK